MIQGFLKDFPHHWSSKIHDLWAFLAATTALSISASDVTTWLQIVSLILGIIFLGLYMRIKKIRNKEFWS